jgi:hypothetical protein
MRYAVIDDKAVVNVIMWDGESDVGIPASSLKRHEIAEIGWLVQGDELIEPPAPIAPVLPLEQVKAEAVARMIDEMEAFLKRFKIGFLPSEIDNWPNLLANSQRILAEGEDAYAPDVKIAAAMLGVLPTDYAQLVIQKATKLGELVGATTAIRTIGERKINSAKNISEVEAALREIRQLATMAAAKLGYQL